MMNALKPLDKRLRGHFIRDGAASQQLDALINLITNSGTDNQMLRTSYAVFVL